MLYLDENLYVGQVLCGAAAKFWGCRTNRMKQSHDAQSIASVAQLLTVVLIVGSLYVGQDIFIPLALGLLLSFLLNPLVDRLERTGVPNVLAVVTTATFAFLMLAGAFTIIGRELSGFVYELPQYKGELITKARSVAGLTSGVGGSLDTLADEVTAAMEGADDKPVPENESTASPPPAVSASEGDSSGSILQQLTARVFPPAEPKSKPAVNDGRTPRTPLYIQPVEKELPLATWAATAGTVLGPLGTAGLVSVFSLFMLIHREDLRDRIIAVVSYGNYVTTTEAFDEVARRISRYLVAQTVINVSYGFVLTVGLIIIGGTMTTEGSFPNALLWGVLAACLRYIPYIGPTASAAFPLALSLAVFPGYSVFLTVLALIIVMELISNNIIEPWLYGTSTGISAVAVIVAAVFWGWLWGPVGLLLSTPLTVCLVVLGRHVPRFKILTTLLGEDVQIKPSLRFYQRLLAGDRQRAKELVTSYVGEKNVDSACDEVLIPAIKRVRSDHDAGELTDENYMSLSNAIDELVHEIKWTVEEPAENAQADEVVTRLPLVMGCPAHHASESVILKIMQAVSTNVWRMRLLDEDMMPAEIGQSIATQNPVVAVIMVLPSGGFAQARFLCKSIRQDGYRGAIIIACMGKFKHFDRLFVRFRKAGATSMTTSFRQTHSKITSIVGRHDRVVLTSQTEPSQIATLM